MTLEDGQRPAQAGEQSTAIASEPQARPPVFVDLGNGQMGIQTDRFNLSGMFAFDSDEDFFGSGRPDTLYLRTKSGNIYMLDSNGRLVNRNQSLEWRTAHVDILNPFALAEADDLVIGEVFVYLSESQNSRGLPRHTTPIVEMVATSEAMRSTAALARRTSAIATDFHKDLPPIPPAGS